MFCCLPIASSSLLSARVQHPAPDFKGTAVVNSDFKEISLNQYKGKVSDIIFQFLKFKSNNFLFQYLVLFFYPLDFTFVCPTEIISFSNRISEFKELDTEVVGVSVDSHYSHLAWCNTDRKVWNCWSFI